MNKDKYVFSQLMELISHKSFQTIVKRHNGEYKVKDFSCWKQFLCMVFGQLTHRESISNTLICLEANTDKLYHMGIGKVAAKSTLTKANENRSYRIYEDLAMLLILQAKELYHNTNLLDINLQNNVFAIDATIIDLCLSSFYWASFHKTKGGIKLHTMLDLKTAIPEFILFTTASTHEVQALDKISFQANSIYIMDRAYVDLKRLYKINACDAFFITRAKSNMDFKRIYSHPVNKKEGVICDQSIIFNNFYPAKFYPEKMRRIKFYDHEKNNTLIFLTNNFHFKAIEIAQLYKHRWDIECFFKWIKQHLKIKSFWGHSENAVKTQVWIAISAYVLVAIAKKKFNIRQSLYEILQVLSLSMFEKVSVNQLFQQTQLQYIKEQNCNQLKLF